MGAVVVRGDCWRWCRGQPPTRPRLPHIATGTANCGAAAFCQCGRSRHAMPSAIPHSCAMAPAAPRCPCPCPCPHPSPHVCARVGGRVRLSAVGPCGLEGGGVGGVPRRPCGAAPRERARLPLAVLTAHWNLSPFSAPSSPCLPCLTF